MRNKLPIQPSPLLTVCITTYNHEKYVKHAIESVLRQETDFPFNVVIGEDDSSDNTRQIVKAFKERYPERITLLLNQRSDVIYVNGRATGRWNFVQTLSSATGKYVAFLEGDDYWTDPLKLQKQVTFLESHSEYSLCGHLVATIDSVGNPHDEQLCSGEQCADVLHLRDALLSTPMHPNSWVFRNFDLKGHPAYPRLLRTPAGDNVLALMLLGQGKGHCIREYCSVYRQHSGGAWSTLPAFDQMLAILQFRVTACHIVPGALRLSSMRSILSSTITLFESVLTTAFRSRSLYPILDFATLSVRQTAISRLELIAVYAAGAIAFTGYALFRIGRKGALFFRRQAAI